ncbi:hypothetical protein ACFQ07_06325 [Actinomadura adrarensis]|uniref:DUF1918 domain-containing protein n=1 Tax=Actinomadura adrarensis TaxID=1819600 RepID=A0ABW3CDB1_9ACTN
MANGQQLTARQFEVGDQVQLLEALDVFGTVTSVDRESDQVEVRWSGYEPLIKPGTTTWGPASRLWKNEVR